MDEGSAVLYHSSGRRGHVGNMNLCYAAQKGPWCPLPRRALDDRELPVDHGKFHRDSREEVLGGGRSGQELMSKMQFITTLALLQVMRFYQPRYETMHVRSFQADRLN